jgi:hypothetical protein
VCGYGCEDHFYELDTVDHCWEAVQVTGGGVLHRAGGHCETLLGSSADVERGAGIAAQRRWTRSHPLHMDTAGCICRQACLQTSSNKMLVLLLLLL